MLSYTLAHTLPRCGVFWSTDQDNAPTCRCGAWSTDHRQTDHIHTFIRSMPSCRCGVFWSTLQTDRQTYLAATCACILATHWHRSRPDGSIACHDSSVSFDPNRSSCSESAGARSSAAVCARGHQLIDRRVVHGPHYRQTDAYITAGRSVFVKRYWSP